jgi:TRAP-type mannitol/chloroaromatic compound transport system permease small subunit
VARYLFNAPTFWAYDLSYMLYAGIFFLGAPYALRRGAHVRTDFLYNALSARARAALDLVGYVLFLPALGFLTLVLFEDALRSWTIRETTDIWRAPYYPLRWMMAVACLLLFLQSLVELIRALQAVRPPPRS